LPGTPQSNQRPMFKKQHDWLSIAGWKENKAAIRHSYQFILLVLKIYEMFECNSFTNDHFFIDLQHFPTEHWVFFPFGKLLQVWEGLTSDQQDQLIAKYGYSHMNSIWGYCLQRFYA